MKKHIPPDPKDASAEQLKQQALEAEGRALLRKVKKYYEVRKKLKSGEIDVEKSEAFSKAMLATRGELSTKIAEWAEDDPRIYRLTAIMIDLYRVMRGVMYELGGCKGLETAPAALSHLSDVSRAVAFSMDPNLDPVLDGLVEMKDYLHGLADKREKETDDGNGKG